MSKTPKLRFKEFSGEWEKSTLNDIANITMGQSPIGESYNSYGEGIGLINGPVEFTDKYPVVVQYTTKPTKYCYKYDILFCVRGSSIGRMNISDDTYCIGRGVAAINAKEGKSTTNYIYSLLQSKLDTLLNFSNGSTFPNISSEEIKKYSVKVPSLEEQEKIASFFSLIDEKICLQGEKLEMLKDYKRGMMQKIFSRELRFKDDEGRDYPDWKEKKLGDIGFFKTSSVDKLINENEEIVYLVNYMDVYKHLDINKDTIINLMQVSAKAAQIENNNLIKGDILFTPSSETPDDIGHSIVIFEDLPKTLYSYHLVRFRPSIKLDLLYSHYFCNIDSVRSQIVRFATGSTRFTVSVNEFSKVKVNIPSYNEQKKIGEFLNNIDIKLRKEQEKLDSLNEYKKGLLQQMFV